MPSCYMLGRLQPCELQPGRASILLLVCSWCVSQGSVSCVLLDLVSTLVVGGGGFFM
jgi:hypothetical protein